MANKPSTPAPEAQPVTGLAHFVAAFGYSMAGVTVLLREAAARQEVVMLPLALGTLALANARFVEFLALIVLFCVLFAVEALNTAIENVVDRTSPEHSDFGRDTKDLGSLAVFCILCAIGALVLAVLARASGLIAW